MNKLSNKKFTMQNLWYQGFQQGVVWRFLDVFRGFLQKCSVVGGSKRIFQHASDILPWRCVAPSVSPGEAAAPSEGSHEKTTKGSQDVQHYVCEW